ncbi:hypothetical protein RJ639_039717 [Escallonia herrerae]|uniref:DUF241 domain protein n=1 Tax=Escallonia herrerae TaxID=1293975 RepID=A0AA89B9H4_9ASTE|nr:hypothetical protein RJ639_039717 [Escallonia herrerae]
MATSKNNSRHNLRSISLPCRSHPTTRHVEEKLNELKTWEETLSVPTAETISGGLSKLEELYKCMDDLLDLPMTKQALSVHQCQPWTNKLLEGSVRLLDICGTARDFMSLLVEHVRDLQSALRRRKGDSSIESSIAKYTSFRKKIKKESKCLIAALNQFDNKIGVSCLLDQDHHLQAVIRVLREVSLSTVSIFETLLMFFSVPVPKQKAAKWLMVSKLMHKGAATCEEEPENVNELESVDAALWSLCRYGSSEVQKVSIAQRRLEALEASIEGFEDRLGCMFRQLIKARASLLNIISH